MVEFLDGIMPMYPGMSGIDVKSVGIGSPIQVPGPTKMVSFRKPLSLCITKQASVSVLTESQSLHTNTLTDINIKTHAAYTACFRIGHASCGCTDSKITLEFIMPVGMPLNAWRTDAMSRLSSEPAAVCEVNVEMHKTQHK